VQCHRETLGLYLVVKVSCLIMGPRSRYVKGGGGETWVSFHAMFKELRHALFCSSLLCSQQVLLSNNCL